MHSFIIVYTLFIVKMFVLTIILFIEKHLNTMRIKAP